MNLNRVLISENIIPENPMYFYDRLTILFMPVQ